MCKYKLRDTDKKTFTLKPEHLNKGARLKLINGHITAYNITFWDIHAAYRKVAEDVMEAGYSVLFTDEVKTKILKYNS